MYAMFKIFRIFFLNKIDYHDKWWMGFQTIATHFFVLSLFVYVLWNNCRTTTTFAFSWNHKVTRNIFFEIYDHESYKIFKYFEQQNLNYNLRGSIKVRQRLDKTYVLYFCAACHQSLAFVNFFVLSWELPLISFWLLFYK